MPYATDNRWSAGSSGATVPDDAPAAYSARWIDIGDNVPADVLPDRQGFAYNDEASRDALIMLMTKADGEIRTPNRTWERDVPVALHYGPAWHCHARRAGGYIYVDAWLAPTVAMPQSETADDERSEA